MSHKSGKLKEILITENLNCSSKSTVLCQELRNYKGVINWSIKKSDLVVDIFGTSKECRFSIGSPDFCKLCLRFFPREMTENTKNFVTLSLCFSNPPPIDAWCHCVVTLLNEKGEILKSDMHSKSEKDLTAIDFSCLTENKKLLDFCKHSKLIIQCSVRISCSLFHCATDMLKHTVEKSCEWKLPPKLFFDKIPTDAIVEIEKEEIPVNKALIASEMPSLRILFNALHEANKKFKLPKDLHIKASVFKEIVCYVYTCNISFKSFKHAIDIFNSACLFKMNKLKNICSAYISTNLHEKNIFLAQNVAQKFNDEELLNACYEFIKNSDTKSLAHSSLLSLDKI